MLIQVQDGKRRNKKDGKMANWISQTSILKDRLDIEIAKAEQEKLARKQTFAPVATPDTWQPQTQWATPQPVETPMEIPQTQTMPQVRQPTQQVVTPTPVPTTVSTPVSPVDTTVTTPAVTTPVSTPFWKRALEVFAAPFNYIDKYVIKPALGVVADPLVPDTVRNEGEDYFSWKRRSWEEWNAPGFTFDMPWGKWKLDVKGVAELAPWLLIPGAGQIGGAVSGLGKAAKAGSMLSKGLNIAGKAIQYSPWGLVEKGTGAVVKGVTNVAGKAIGKTTTPLSEKMYGKIVPKELTPVEKELLTDLQTVVEPAFNKVQKAIKTELRPGQAAQAARALKDLNAGKITMDEYVKVSGKAGGVKEYFNLSPQELATRQADDIANINTRVANGELDASTGKGLITRITNDPQYQSPISKWTPDKIMELTRPIREGIEKDLTKKDILTEMNELLTLGKIPAPRFFNQISEIYGSEFAQGLKGFTSRGKGNLEKILDILNIPRATLASGDLSGTLRQGAILSVTHPLIAMKAFGRQLKAFASEKLSLDMDAVARATPEFKSFVNDGGFWADISKTAQTGLANIREEAFASRFAEKLPLVRQSERAYVTYLNELRLGAYKSVGNVMRAGGATDAEMKGLARFINLSSGRGDLPAKLDAYAPLLNSVFFSARKQLATLQLPKMLGSMLVSKNPYMRKEAARALITFVGGGVSLLALLKASGVADVEGDPRSADFGKIKFKNSETRLDIWTGYLQYIRFAAQMLSSQKKSAYGNLNKADRLQLAASFVQSKTAPAMGLVVDLLKGQTYDGEPVFGDTQGLITGAGKRIIPLTIQDMMDAFEQNGVNGLAQAAPSVLGVGVLTYVNKFLKLKNDLAKQNGKGSWEDLDPLTQRRLEQIPEYQVAALQFDRDVMGSAWGDWHSAGNAIETNFKEDIDQASAKYAKDGDGVAFREKVGDAYTAKQGAYDARDKEDRFSEIVARNAIEDPTQSLVKLGAEQFAIQTYMKTLHGKDMIDEFGDYRFDEAEKRKLELKTSLDAIQPGLYDYVEEYLGMKYDNYPAVFKEFQQAKIALKPYWSVQDEVEKTYGVAKSVYQQKRIDSLVSKIHKRMRATDRNIAYYYDKFYTTQT
jgi:hypothetical protein